MKKKLLFILIVIVLSSCLYAVSFGYGYSMEGFSGFNQSSSSRLSFALDLTDSRYLTVEGGAGLGFRGWKI